MAIYKFCGFLNTVRHIAHKMMFWKDAERVYAFFISKNDPNETLMYRFTLMRLKTFYSEAMCKIQGNIQYCGIIREYHLIKSFRLTDKGKIMFLPIDKGYITDEVKGGYIILAKDKASFKRALLNTLASYDVLLKPL